MWKPKTCDSESNKACKIDEYLDVKNYYCEKCLIGKLVLDCESEILNTTETLLNDKKVAQAKRNCLFSTISLVIIFLLLLVVTCVSCYFRQKKCQSRPSFHNINIK